MSDYTRWTTAEPETVVPGRWLVGAMLVFAGALGAAAVPTVLAGDARHVALPVLVAAATVLAVVSFAAALVYEPHPSPRGVVAAVSMALPTLAVAAIPIFAVEEDPAAAPLYLSIVALTVVPLAIGIGIKLRKKRLGRGETTVGTVPGAPPLTPRDIVRATDGGRADVVVREYRDDADGQARLAADVRHLDLAGYTVADVKRHRGWPPVVRGVAWFLLVLANMPWDVGQPRQVVAFRRRASNHEP